MILSTFCSHDASLYISSLCVLAISTIDDNDADDYVQFAKLSNLSVLDRLFQFKMPFHDCLSQCIFSCVRPYSILFYRAIIWTLLGCTIGEVPENLKTNKQIKQKQTKQQQHNFMKV